MRGLIYKDFSIFYKCIDKKVIAIAVGFTALLIFSAGNYVCHDSRNAEYHKSCRG